MLSLVSFFALSATAGHQSTTVAPTLEVSCTACVAGQSIVFSGSGFKSRAQVELDIQGPVSYSIITSTDANGNIYVDYGTALSYDAGSYSVVASAISGKTLTPQATQSFSVQ